MFPVHQDPTATQPCASTTGFFCTLNDSELLSEVHHLAARERHATADLIAALMEVERRRLYLGEGCSSLYAYCTQILHLSEHAAYGRIQAARATSKFPAILPLLIDGSVTLTTIVLLAPHLTEENHASLLAAVRHKSKRHIEQLIARVYPQPDVPSCIRLLSDTGDCGVHCLPGPRQSTGHSPNENFSSDSAMNAGTDNTPVASLEPISRGVLSPSAVVSPLSAERYRLQMTIRGETLEQLRAVQDLLRRAIPNGDVATIFERALALLHGELLKKKAAATERPRSPSSPNPAADAQGGAVESPKAPEGSSQPEAATSPAEKAEPNGGGSSRYIPAAVRRQVWARDQGQCAFVGSQGRCAETGFLEFHHVLPHAAGGEPTVENIELRCRPHNVYEAERYFGVTEPFFIKESRPTYGFRASNSVRTELPPTCPLPPLGGDHSPAP